MTAFEVCSSRKISNLKVLKNNFTTSEKNLFLRHGVSILKQLMTYSDCLDYVFVNDFKIVAVLGESGSQSKKGVFWPPRLAPYHQQMLGNKKFEQ